jgi:hypothetical protein
MILPWYAIRSSRSFPLGLLRTSRSASSRRLRLLSFFSIVLVENSKNVDQLCVDVEQRSERGVDVLSLNG